MNFLRFKSLRQKAGNSGQRWFFPFLLSFLALVVSLPFSSFAADNSAAASHFYQTAQPILTKYCSDCHADGEKKGNVDFDLLKPDGSEMANHELWSKVLKNVRAGLMPPEKKPRPAADDLDRLASCIKYDAFGIDPKDPDPGRVTVRRLNRFEYRNTIRDLMGIDFDTANEFPPDDTGYGFDNIGDVLTLPPMLLEKYLAAARTIVERTIPTIPKVPAEFLMTGTQFHRTSTNSPSIKNSGKEGQLSLSYYEPATATNSYQAEHSGTYSLVVNLSIKGDAGERAFDSNRCEIVFTSDGKELLRKEYGWHDKKDLQFKFDQQWQAGSHQLAFDVRPVLPKWKQASALEMRIVSVTVQGPKEEKYWTRPKNYERYFAHDAPSGARARRNYAREILGPFAQKAFRRPIDRDSVDRLAALAESIYTQRGKTFESGVAEAMVAILASPRFIFREEDVIPANGAGAHPFIDEYALASRLSYLLWSSMPDDELFHLAAENGLRANLGTQVKRMMADKRFSAFIQNFPGQWLQSRDIDTVAIDARSILAREESDPEVEKSRSRMRELRNKDEEKLTPDEKAELAKLRAEFFKSFGQVRVDLTGELRTAMRKETEMFFEHIVRDDRSLLDLVDSDYTYLNEKLAKHYGIKDVKGDQMRLVSLPADSPRGGVLTQGTVLAVTSNPTRTSPVKRGLFILDNILGVPPPPPPPDIPPLEDAAKEAKGRTLSLRETLEIHRSKPLCSSCHNRMDPLGLALENFNAMGMWRDQENKKPLEVSGKLITGEPFSNIRELKHILAQNHRSDIYRTATEKLLTYALGRGLEYYDVETVDAILERLQREDGHFSALLNGVIESAPFQKRRNPNFITQSEPPKAAQQRADLNTLKP